MSLEKIYYVNAGKDGTFADSGHVKSSPNDVNELFHHLEETDIEKLIIYFHGGLVSEQNGLAAAAVMKNYFADPTSKRHVVSFVWETGPMEIIREHLAGLKSLKTDEFFEEISRIVIKLVGRRLNLDDSAKGGSGAYLSDETIALEKQKLAPFEELDINQDAKGGFTELEIQNELVYMAKLEQEANFLIRSSKPKAKEILTSEFENTKDKSVRGLGIVAVAKFIGSITLAVIKRYIHKTQHDFYPTIMEEAFRKFYIAKLGSWGWNEIKQKSADMFKSNEGREGDNLYVGTYFFSKLNTLIEQRKAAGKTLDIELIGHSAGTIVICDLLHTTPNQFTSTSYNNVFFLAPACRTDVFLEKGKKAKETGVFKHFKMFTMKDEVEKKDHCIPVLYTRSLLYLISGLFEEETDAKIMGLHEHLKGEGRYAEFEELKSLKDFMSENKIVLSVDELNPDESIRSASIKHGNFDNDHITLQSILKTIS